MAILHTESLCPECLKKVQLDYLRRGDTVYLSKECADHGWFETPVWKGQPDIEEWMNDSELSPPAKILTETVDGCPFDCGVCPEHRQQACCVVIEITGRCNQNCPVCYASSSSDRDIETDRLLADIIADLKFLKKTGEVRPFNIQFSGGEPTLRDDLCEIIRAASDLGFPYIQLNTNGRRLADNPEYAFELKKAGLSAIFLQFDGLTDEVYMTLRGEVLVEKKKRALGNCAAAGLGVVLVMTLVRGVNDNQLGPMVEFVSSNLPAVRGLHLQPVSYFGRFPDIPKGPQRPERLTMPEIFRALETQLEGAVKAEHMKPLRSGHPLCSFHGRFCLTSEGKIVTLPGNGADKSSSCCSVELPAIIRARDFLSDKWTMPDEKTNAPSKGVGYNVSAWDDYIQRIKNFSFSITGMLFQDAYTLDLDRLASCRVHVLTKERKLIPFCAYNLTSRKGDSLYRKQSAFKVE